MQRVMLLNQDPPEHTRRGRSSRRGFTPRSIGALEEIMTERAHRIVTGRGRARHGRLRRGGRRRAAAAGDRRPARRPAGGPAASSSTGPTRCWPARTRSSRATPDVAAAEILGYAMAMAADRKANPRDDIVTKLINADKDGRGLTDDEFGYFVIILAVAGNETTRNAITHGMNAFLDNPDQWELWKSERPDDHGRRGHPVGHAGQRLPAHRAQRRRGRGRADQGGPAGRDVLRAARTTTRTSSTTRYTFDITARPQPAPRVRWPRRALLHRRQPGPPGDPADLRRARRPRARHPPGSAEPRRLRHGWINGIKELQVTYAG